MADHNLRITAQLDTSQLNQELDRLNQQRGGGGANDTTGNGISLGMRLRQLQLSLDNLNRSLQIMMRRSGVGGTGGEGKGLADDKSLGAMLGSDRRIDNRFARARLGKELIEKGLISKTAWGSEANRLAFFDSPEGQQYRERYNAVSEETETRANKGRRQLRMGLAVGGHFAGMIGQSLQDAGFTRAASAFNIFSGGMGGAASGAMMGGAVGAAIGGLIGISSSLTSEFAKLRNATENLTKQIEKNLADAFKSLERHETDNEMEDMRNTLHDEWTDLTSVENVMNVSDVRIDAISNRIEELESQLEQRRAELEAGQGEAAPLSIRGNPLFKDAPDWLVKSLDTMADFIGPQFTEVGEKANEAAKEIPELVKKIDELRQRAKEWEEIGNSAEDMLDRADPYSNENHEKFVEEMNRQAEVERENEERRKQLLMMREQILLGIEQEYAQQGVDILSGMGKSGKYMSQAEAASTSQERYAPITKKLDTMQKSLDHLSQIDAKLRNLNIGLT